MMVFVVMLMVFVVMLMRLGPAGDVLLMVVHIVLFLHADNYQHAEAQQDHDYSKQDHIRQHVRLGC